MAEDKELKRIERRAKSMLLNKEIPADKMDIVRSLMKDPALKPIDQHNAIIDILKDLPEKKVIAGDDIELKDEESPKKKKKPAPKKKKEIKAVQGPTETAYYVDDILKKYKKYRLFRKKYLVHRDNRLGIGFRKRLVPTKSLVKLLEQIGECQEIILQRLPDILDAILYDKEADDPVLYNFIQVIRNWMMDVPFIDKPYDTVAWMERKNYDELLKKYILHFFSFYRLNPAMREQIINEIENRLRSFDDLEKEEIQSKESDQVRRGKEKRNLVKEKYIHEYLMLVRSFLPNRLNEETYLAKKVNIPQTIDNLPELLLNMTEALVFQRPFKMEELISYYGIDIMTVSTEKWDCSDDILAKAGKDNIAKKEKQLDLMKKELSSFDSLVFMMKYNDKGRNLLIKSAEDHWRMVEKKQWDPQEIYKKNFIAFLLSCCNYFFYSYKPVINGSATIFRDSGREEHEGTLFSQALLAEEISLLESNVKELQQYRNDNQSIEYSRTEIKDIIGSTEEAAPPADFILSIGNSFYSIWQKLQKSYDLHKLWLFNGGKLTNPDVLKRAVQPFSDDDDVSKFGRPFPFHDSVIVSISTDETVHNTVLGKRILEDAASDGLLITITAFAVQMAYICLNSSIEEALSGRKKLMASIKGLKGEK